MKQWIIWAGIAVLAVLLAVVAIPWALMPIDSTDQNLDLPTPRADRGDADVNGGGEAPADGKMHFDEDEEPADANNPAPDIGAAPGAGSNSDEGEPYINPARAERKERMAQADVAAMREFGSAWMAIVRFASDAPHDPVADHTMQRIDELQKDIAAYRRTPDDFDFDELASRQRHILGELKQTSYWGPRLAEMETRIEEALNQYERSSEP